MKYLLALVVMMLVPSLGLAAQQTTSFKTIEDKSDYKEYQMFRCDESGSITGGGSDAIGSSTCASADWSRPVDCRGFTHLTAHYFEYGDGSGELKVWDCSTSKGFLDIELEGATEAPVTTPTAADPKPFCTDITAGAGVTMIGTTAGVQRMDLSGLNLGFVVYELQDCTGNCDGTALLKCGK